MSKKIPHYIYLLRKSENVRCHDDIYKIGQTDNVKQRFNSAEYRHAEIILTARVTNAYFAEQRLIELFNFEFENVPKCGREYFKGNIDQMCDVFLQVAKEYRFTKDNNENPSNELADDVSTNKYKEKSDMLKQKEEFLKEKERLLHMRETLQAQNDQINTRKLYIEDLVKRYDQIPQYLAAQNLNNELLQQQKEQQRHNNDLLQEQNELYIKILERNKLIEICLINGISESDIQLLSNCHDKLVLCIEKLEKLQEVYGYKLLQTYFPKFLESLEMIMSDIKAILYADITNMPKNETKIAPTNNSKLASTNNEQFDTELEDTLNNEQSNDESDETDLSEEEKTIESFFKFIYDTKPRWYKEGGLVSMETLEKAYNNYFGVETPRNIISRNLNQKMFVYSERTNKSVNKKLVPFKELKKHF